MNQLTSQLIAQAFNDTIIVSDMLDVQQTPLYDTATVAAAGTFSSQTVQWFVTPQNSGGKTIADTNLTQARQLTAPQTFSIQGYKIYWGQLIFQTDLYNILNGYVYEFYLGDTNKVYQRAPLWFFPAGGGVYSAFAPANVLTTASFNNGWPGREASWGLAIPLVIQNQMTFYAQVNGASQTLTAGGGAGGLGARIMNILDGYYARGIM